MKLWLCFIGIVLLAGCARFQPQPLVPENSATQFEARRLDDAGLKQFVARNLGHELKTWPPEKWSLSELTLAAFYFHPSLEVAKDEWLVASAGITTAGARPNPSVTVTPGYDSQIPGNYSPWLVPVTFDLPIETAGKRGKRLAEAEKVSESARWNFISAAWKIRSDVRASLLDFILTGRRAELLQQQFAMQTQIVKRLQQRLDTGEISRPELTVASIALNRAQLDLNQAQADESSARSHLAGALGLTEAALAGTRFDYDFSSPPTAQLTSVAARTVALRSRADILAALADYAAAEADLRLQIAKQYPDLHLGPGYAWNSGNAGDNQWSLGVTLELPILDQNQGPIAEAEARRKLSAAKFIELQAQVIGEIDQAQADFRVAQAQLSAGQHLLAVEQQQQAAAEAQLQAGAAEPLDLLTAQLEFNTAQLAQLDSLTRQQAAFGALEGALQCPADLLATAIVKLAELNPPSK
ncbi:MAG TPA: TolC family protein [Verrucomicrobiae bacterium]|jgi:outer membrane protein TolC